MTAVAGIPAVSDPLSALTAGRAGHGVLRRGAGSFFQANRFLLPSLVTGVMDTTLPDGEVLDLYAGVGLFAVSLVAAGHLEVTAVEADRASGADLRRNGRPYEPKIASHIARVEDYLAVRRGRPAVTTILDPPRTGISKEALSAVIAHGSARIVYVSCDPATLARDLKRFAERGYALSSVVALDMFPQTHHVEAVMSFER
jgi:23S rRNA (uracil1939-C5)-methyltransferase